MRRKKLEKMPLYQKGVSILEIVDRIVELVPEENEYLSSVAGYMYEDAMQLAPKIASAVSADLYDIQMENATIIRKCARQIYVSCNGFVVEGFKDVEYLDVLRAEIEEFRVLFAEWVKTFDQWNYIIDRWGLFNPPGVNYNDIDPDDSLPFDNPFDDMEDSDEEDEFDDEFDDDDYMEFDEDEDEDEDDEEEDEDEDYRD